MTQSLSRIRCQHYYSLDNVTTSTCNQRGDATLMLVLQSDSMSSKDWRLDSFQARNLNLYMNVSLTVQANLLEMNSLGVCVRENGVYTVGNCPPSLPACSRLQAAAKTGDLRNRSWWNQNCLNANQWDINYRCEVHVMADEGLR